ncbi:hypothetical protein HPB52_014561 [Rhipicephalus sanguineus]|uniref:Bridge-like lipid transfer protein family member 1 C-terminal domain-containing protein n=1 Tax=Rhipicephalus sanguineus TaxID=34632 RepID=A0A9D4Q9F5_RHISA|nr:hypothetical protein HPB52_014561 [Rhipicephalus sanguineus]
MLTLTNSRLFDADATPAVVVTLENTRISACSCGSLVSKARFTGLCLRFADEFEVSMEDWKPSDATTTNLCVVSEGTYEICSRTIAAQATSNAKWILNVQWQMEGVDIHVDVGISKALSALFRTLTALTGEGDEGESPEEQARTAQISGEVPESEKVDCVLRQIHPQLQDLGEGKQFANLAELGKAAGGLMEHYWGRFQYKPTPPPTGQVSRDLAFQPAGNVAGLSGAQPRVMVAAAAAPFQLLSAASHWPLHPVAIQPFYHRDQLHRFPASAARPHLPTPPQPQEYQPLDSGRIACHCCRGVVT